MLGPFATARPEIPYLEPRFEDLIAVIRRQSETFPSVGLTVMKRDARWQERDDLWTIAQLRIEPREERFFALAAREGVDFVLAVELRKRRPVWDAVAPLDRIRIYRFDSNRRRVHVESGTGGDESELARRPLAEAVTSSSGE